MDVKASGEGRKLVLGQTNPEHLICCTPTLRLCYLMNELISCLWFPFRLRQSVFCKFQKVSRCNSMIQFVLLLSLFSPPCPAHHRHPPRLPTPFPLSPFWCVCLHGFWALSNSIWPQQRRRRREKKNFHMCKLGPPRPPNQPLTNTHTQAAPIPPTYWLPRLLMMIKSRRLLALGLSQKHNYIYPQLINDILLLLVLLFSSKLHVLMMTIILDWKNSTCSFITWAPVPSVIPLVNYNFPTHSMPPKNKC